MIFQRSGRYDLQDFLGSDQIRISVALTRSALTII